MTKGQRRISFTKLQRQTAIGVELLSLCQTVTEDGRLSDNEIGALRQWLEDNQSVNLPAKDFLRESVEKILADGKVTDEERQELFHAIEIVLPSDLRTLVRDKRVAAERAVKDQLCAERATAKQAAQEERFRNLPLDKWDFMVAGSRYEGRPDVISRFANPGDPAYLARDYANRYSKNAIEVRLSNGMQIGFVPETDAVEVAPLLDAGHPHEAYIKKILTGGRSPIPVVVASIYSMETQLPRLVFADQVPAKVMFSPSSRVGCVGILTVLILVAAIAAVLSLW